MEESGNQSHGAIAEVMTSPTESADESVDDPHANSLDGFEGSIVREFDVETSVKPLRPQNKDPGAERHDRVNCPMSRTANQPLSQSGIQSHAEERTRNAESGGEPNLLNQMRLWITDDNYAIDPQMICYISRMEYPKVLLGTSAMTLKVHPKLKANGPMNEAERNLFKHINTILQYPPCIRRSDLRKAVTRRLYGYSIKRYLLFMARSGSTPSNFRVDGILMTRCMEEYVESKAEDFQLKTLNFSATIEAFIYAMEMLQNCLGLYTTKDIADGNARMEKISSKYTGIPNIESIREFSKHRRKQHRQVSRDHFRNKDRGNSFCLRHLKDDVRTMMINMYQLTGSLKKHDVFDGINAVLGFLLDYHLLFRNIDKRMVEFSDAEWTEEDTEQDIIPVLTFKHTTGKTLESASIPRRASACRNKVQELCLISAFAISLWYRFDFAEYDAPLTGSQAPDFENKKSWHHIKVLFAKSSSSSQHNPISYNYEQLLRNKCLESIGFVSLMCTHNEKRINAQNVDTNVDEVAQTRRGGRCTNDSLQNKYTPNLSSLLSHHTAVYGARKPKFITRDVETPEELQKKIFPWLDDSMEKVGRSRSTEAQSSNMKDVTAPPFLEMLRSFRKIILQDLAVLVDKCPNSIFSQHPITKDPIFVKFKARVDASVKSGSLQEDFEETQNVADSSSLAFNAEILALISAIKASDGRTRHLFGLIQDQLSSVLNQFKRMDYNHLSLVEQISVLVDAQAKSCLRLMLNEHTFTMNKCVSKTENLFSHMESRYSDTDRRISDMERLIFRDCGKCQILVKPRHLHQSDSDVNAPITSNLRSELSSAASGTTHEPNSSIEEMSVRLKRRKVETCTHSFTDFLPMKDWTLSKLTVTVPQLVLEWFVAKDGMPSVVQRDTLRGAQWRREIESFYKRRRALIMFIQNQLKINKVFQGFSHFEFANFLEEYRQSHKLKMNGLCHMCQSAKGRMQLAEGSRHAWTLRHREALGRGSDN